MSCPPPLSGSSLQRTNGFSLICSEILYGQSFPVSPEILSDDFTLRIGDAKIERPGKDITIVTHSIGVSTSLNAAEILKKEEGIEAEVINLRSIRPLDVPPIVASVKKTNRLVTVEGGCEYMRRL